MALADGRVLGVATGLADRERRIAMTPETRMPGGSRYGLGIRIAETPLGTTYGHGGSMPGHRSQLIYFPGDLVAIAIQVNTDVPPVSNRLAAYAAALAKVALHEPTTK